MKKLLLIALLTVAMVFTLVACTEEKPPEETTGETKGDTIPVTGDETEPETPAEDTKAPDTDPVDETDPPVEDTKAPETDPPVEDTKAPETDPPVEDTKAPETDPPVVDEGPVKWDVNKDVVTHLSFDELRKNDTADGIFAPGQAAGWDLQATVDEEITSLKFWGWIGIADAEVGLFGYQIDDNDPIYDAAWTHATGQDVLDAAAGTGAQTASRMLINIDLSKIAGEHTVKTLYKNAAGDKAVILAEFTITRNAPQILDPASAGMIRNNVDAETADNYSASIAGWIGFGQPVTALGYAVDGGEIVWLEGGINNAPEQAVIDLAGEHAIRYGIQADLTGVDYGEHEVVYYVRLEDRNMCEFHGQVAVTNDPSIVNDSTYAFNSAETADLSAIFKFGAGASPELCNYTAAPYKMSGINQLTLTAEGTFVWTVSNLATADGHAVLFVRGNPNPTFGDANYYGHDGNNDKANPDSLSVGCAGIYFGIEEIEGTPYLRLNVKGKNGDTAVPHVFKAAMTSRNITVMDNNDVITFLNDGAVIATVDVNGFDKGYATEAVVTLADGTTETLTDVCCAATTVSDIGFIARSVDMTFDAVTLTSLAAANPFKAPTEVGHKNSSYDTFYVNNNMYFPQDGGAADKLNEINNTIEFAADAAHDSMALRGWIGFEQAIDSFGYYIDSFMNVTWGEFKQDTEAGVLGAGGEFASRYMVTADLSGLSAGTHIVGFVVKLADGSQAILHKEITVVIAAAEEPADPNTPVHLIPADQLVAPEGCNSATTVLGDGFVTVTPLTNDPNYSVPAGFVGSRYIGVKYRTSTADKCNLQLYLASTGTGPKDDTTMLQLPLTGDGEWRLLIFDLDTMPTKLNAEYYVSYIRLDALQAGFQTDENGNYIYIDGSTTNIAKLPIPEGATIDIAYIAFFNSEEAAKAYAGISDEEPKPEIIDTTIVTEKPAGFDGAAAVEFEAQADTNVAGVNIGDNGTFQYVYLKNPDAVSPASAGPCIPVKFTVDADGTYNLLVALMGWADSIPRTGLVQIDNGAYYYICAQGNEVSTQGQVPEYIQLPATELTAGEHTFTIYLADDFDNSTVKSLYFDKLLVIDANAAPSVDTVVEGASSTIVANDMLGVADSAANSEYAIKDYKGDFMTNKNLFSNDAMGAGVVTLAKDGEDIYAHYALPAGSVTPRILYKAKYMGLADNADYIGTQYLIFRYRTNVTQAGALSAGYEADQREGNLPPTAITWEADGEWHTYAIKLTAENGGLINVLNLWITSDATSADYYFDLDYIAFYADEASWNAAQGIVPVLTPEEAGLKHINKDSLNADNYSASVAGWMGFGDANGDIKMVALGWSIDDGDITWDGSITAPADAELPLMTPSAGEFVKRFTIKASLEGLAFGEHTVYYYAELENGNICNILVQEVTTKDPSAVGSSTVNYNSAENADLSSVMTFMAGINMTGSYKSGPYKIDGINQITKTMDGTYEMTVSNLQGSALQGTMVFRGNPNPNFGDPNYYGTDYAEFGVGCAGIYATILTENGAPALKINVRGVTADNKPVVHLYSVAMTGYDLKIVDDNKSVKFYEGDTLLATVALTGNDAGYATQAVVTANGVTETLDDVCAAATAASDIGFIARGQWITFDAVTIKGA